MTNLLKSKTPLAPKQGRLQNSINGSDAESFALAKMVLACRGEGQWASREEDNSKIDLIFSTEHPWKPGERMLVLSQVKSGKTYGEITGNAFRLKAAAKKAAKRTTHNICVVWVDRDVNELYWAYLHPNSSIHTQKYGAHHRVTPATVFDLARCSSEAMMRSLGGRGIELPRTGTDFRKERSKALASYRDIREVESPSLGKIEFTRLGWRHMFRRSRPESYKAASIELIPYLPLLLERVPSRALVTDATYSVSEGFEYRKCDFLLEYDDLKIRNSVDQAPTEVTAFIKVTEETRYPANWSEVAMLSQIVDRRVVLKSAYYKEI